jgi:dephospho-CoA kinase
MIIGLTGPIGAGKNEVAKIFKEQKAVVIDVDRIAHALYVPQTPLWQALVKAFGSKILKRGGEVSRRRLREIVLSDRKKLEELNRLVHPVLKEAVISEIEKQKKLGKELMVVSAALIKEIGLLSEVDEVWVVTAPKEKRIRRIVRQRKLNRKEVKAFVRAQKPEKEYLKIADVVIKNDQTLKKLKEKVLSIIQERFLKKLV